MDIEAGERARWARCAGLDRNESARRDVGLHETSFWCCGSLLSNGRASALHTFHRSPSSVWCAKFPFLQRFPQIWWQTFHSRNPVYGVYPSSRRRQRHSLLFTAVELPSELSSQEVCDTEHDSTKPQVKMARTGVWKKKSGKSPNDLLPGEPRLRRDRIARSSERAEPEACGGWPRQEPPGLDGTRGPPGRASGGAQRLLPISGRQTQLTLTHAVD